MTKNNCILSFATVAALSVSPAFAGDEYVAPVGPSSSLANSGDWCNTLQNIGKIYKNKENPYFSEFKVFGRLHYQYGYVDGEGVDNEDFSEDFSEVRRARLGLQAKFLKYFKLKAEANFANDTRERSDADELETGYQDFETLFLEFNAGKAFGINFLDKSTVTFGKLKVPVGFEQHSSSKEIKTVERSALANKIRPGNSTGIRLDAKKGNWSGTLGYYSAEEENELSFYDSDDGEFLAASTSYKFANKDKVILDFVYDIDHDGEGETDEVEWVASASYLMKRGRFNFAANLVYGENGDADGPGRDGSFYGVVLQPSYWLIDDVLEVVGQYQYQASDEDEGIRTNSRYSRANGLNTDVDDDDEVNGGRGDSHHTIYAGLNWYLCGDNSKILLGAQWETLDTPEGSTEATTLLAAYRIFF